MTSQNLNRGPSAPFTEKDPYTRQIPTQLLRFRVLKLLLQKEKGQKAGLKNVPNSYS